ncbi:hypothetical protein ACMA5K_24265 [Bradyrhizobium diazoefficiens]|uniref:hypothetical protein n=1 Tax=Bradyrhizobium diazoefficiens TaxID=1355477 RepID=UPI000BE9F8A2|nr:hypothetical protein [Bradyrhizobium diazoefficiens]PDT58698.1 hypothetical protein CO678_26055 [Bradyrhizobium diazoefficiens]QLD43857.1 hypothetical protein HUW42_24045 [Bradyrhizobium diazoefficiens]
MSTNVIVTAISIAAFAGFMTGYTIAWWQRGRYFDKSLDHVAEPEVTTLVVGDLETRFRRSQR